MTVHNKKRKKSPFKSQKRALNVVYFLDAKKTKSIKIPMPMVKLLAAGTILTLVWTVVSFFIVGALTNKVSNLSEELVELNQVIFDYQARFDGVYEAAYPNEKSKLYELVNKAPDAIAEKNIVSTDGKEQTGQADKTEDSKKGLVSLSAKALPNNNESGKSEEEIKKLEALAAAADKLQEKEAVEEPEEKSSEYKVFPSLKIKKARLKPGKESAVLSILLKNSSSRKVSGFVWAVATLQDGEQIKYIASPSRVSIDSNGEVSNPENSKRFALRNYSNKKFTFPINSDQIDQLSHIKVGLVSPDGHTRKVRIPIKK